MKLYHGSKYKITQLEARQASGTVGEVPDTELQNALYLTPDYGFAIAMAARPENGATTTDDERHIITFEKPETFEPDRTIYIYTIDTDDIPDANLLYVDELQYAVRGQNITPIQEEEFTARKVLEYYELANWREGEQIESSAEYSRLR